MSDVQIDSKEAVVLSCLLQREDYVRQVVMFIEESLFESRFPQFIFRHMNMHFDKYKNLPTEEAMILSLESEKQLSDSNLKDILDTLSILYDTDTSHHKLDWLMDMTEEWVQYTTCKNGIMEAVNILHDSGNRERGEILEIMKKAMGVHFDKDIGHDYVVDAHKRFEFYSKTENKIPCDLSMLNTITNGGVTRKTFNAIAALSGGGKSMLLTHLAASYIKDGLNVLYISMEMAEERIAERIDANLMNIPIQNVQTIPFNQYARNVDKISSNYAGKIIIKEYPTGASNANHFRHLLDELETKKGFIPDILIIDYLNICASSRVKANNGTNSYSLIKSVSEELRGLAIEKNVVLWTALQLNRNGMGSSDPEMTDVADSIGISYTADLLLALVNTEELMQIGQCMMKQMKNRYHDVSTNNKFILGVERPKMRFFDAANSSVDNNREAEYAPESDSYGSGFGRSDLKAMERQEKYSKFKFE